MSFDKKVFEGKFNAGVKTLAKAEGAVRETLNELSRSVLEATHATENIGYINKLMTALTPVNRKAAVVFFKHFAGFHYDEATKLFTKKSKKRYDNAHKLALAFLEDPLNNLFSWAERHVEVEQKPFDPDSFKKGFKRMFDQRLQQARDHGMTQAELFALLFKKEDGKVGIDVSAIVSVLEAMGEVDVKEEEPALM